MSPCIGVWIVFFWSRRTLMPLLQVKEQFQRLVPWGVELYHVLKRRMIKSTHRGVVWFVACWQGATNVQNSFLIWMLCNCLDVLHPANLRLLVIPIWRRTKETSWWQHRTFLVFKCLCWKNMQRLVCSTLLGVLWETYALPNISLSFLNVYRWLLLCTTSHNDICFIYVPPTRSSLQQLTDSVVYLVHWPWEGASWLKLIDNKHVIPAMGWV